MSAIAGIVAATGRKAGRGTVGAMLEAMARRGPDGRAVRAKGRAALGHGLLAVVDEAGEDAQPLVWESLVIAADARLDNRDELIAALSPPDASVSDARLILMAYRRWGETCAAHLVGDFAFAIWDETEGALYAARDHGGVRPFQYHVGEAGFAFASESKGLFAAGAPRETDELRIAEFVVGAPPPEDRTLYRELMRLPPAHWLKTTGGPPRIVRYWSPQAIAEVARKDAPEAFLEALKRAVSDRMRASSPVAAMLSGGLDSSAIAALAAPLSKERFGVTLPTYSMVFDERPQWSERDYIEAVLRAGDFDPTLESLERHAPMSGLADALFVQDGLYIAPSMGFSAHLYRKALAAGRKVVLNGHGGDEVVSFGYGRLAELAAAGRWLTLWPEMRGVARTWEKPALPLMAQYFSVYGPSPALRPLWRRLAGRMERLRARGRPAETPRWRRLIDPELAARTGVGKSRREAFAPTALAQTEREHHLASLAPRMQSYALEVLDRAAAAEGVEVRYPFWDKRLIELTLSLPAEEKLAGGWPRLVMRRAMEGVLPPRVQWRTSKLDFTPHVVLGMVEQHAEMIDDLILDRPGELGAYVNLAEAAAVWRRVREQKAGADGLDVQDAWRAAALSLWLRNQRRSDGGAGLA